MCGPMAFFTGIPDPIGVLADDEIFLFAASDSDREQSMRNSSFTDGQYVAVSRYPLVKVGLTYKQYYSSFITGNKYNIL